MSTVPFSRQRPTPLPADIAKKMPSNLDAERSVLGAILLDNAALKEITGSLRIDDFFLEQHRRIFEAIQNLALEELKAGRTLHQQIDLLTVTEYLSNQGTIEAAGGTPYIASLCDGMARVTNVRHYAQIIMQKARMRKLIHLSHDLQQRAFEGEETPDQLLQNTDAALKQLVSTTDENPAVVVGFQSLLKRECAPIEHAIEPLLSRRGTGEIYGWRGVGKSLIATAMATDIAVGSDMLWGGHKGGGGHWTVTRPFRQLYVYGEMDESEIQGRIRMIAKMRGISVPSDEMLGTMCMDFQKNWRPRLSTARDRKFIEKCIFEGGYEGLWLDNLSTLWPSGSDDEGERDAILAEWYTDLNQRGIWVIWLHHAGKGGEQRGGSQKEDMLSFVLKLHRPKKEEMRVIVSVEKNRHKCEQQSLLWPFEISLIRNGQGNLEWATRPAAKAQRIAAFEMFKNKMPTPLAGQEIGVSRATIYRWKQEFDENQNPDFHTDPEE